MLKHKQPHHVYWTGASYSWDRYNMIPVGYNMIPVEYNMILVGYNSFGMIQHDNGLVWYNMIPIGTT